MEKQSIIIYEEENWKISVDILIENKTFWMTQSQMWELFLKDRTTIIKHIQNIYKEGELLEKNTIVQKTHNWSIKPTNYYNLDLILSVWYRVKSKQWILFRKWATNRLKEYLLDWFSINEEKIKSWKATEYFDKLQDKLREIRLSEKIFYQIFTIALTSKWKDNNPFYYKLNSPKFNEENKKHKNSSYCILSQVKVMDKKRFTDKIGYIKSDEFKIIKEKLKEFLL